MDKKANLFGNISGIAVGLLTVMVVLVFFFLFGSQGLQQIESIEDIDASNATECSTSAACNATKLMIDAGGDIPEWMPLIVLAMIAVVLLGIVAYFRRAV